MATYTLSIQDIAKTEGKVTKRAVKAISDNFSYHDIYNPNAESRPFNYDKDEFDTSFSIVHPFRDVANVISQYAIINRDGKPVMNYDCSVNDAQRRVFENILDQEYQTVLDDEIDALKNRISTSE